MEIVPQPKRNQWKDLLQRPYVDNSAVIDKVKAIVDAVKKDGDEALLNFTKKFDGVDLLQIQITEKEVEEAMAAVPQALKNAIQAAKKNIETFHAAQLKAPKKITTTDGVECWQKSVAIQKVGLYIPGGTAPLFSTVLMLAIPAQIAGCKQIVLCTPAGKNGQVHPAILYTAQLAGIKAIYKVGGAQAIAAMAYGTATIPSVYKIFGPGNQYVTAAKQLVQMEGIAIDMPAGPSEVCVLADDTANAGFVAADLLSQAEHGVDSQVLLVTTSYKFAKNVETELQNQLEVLPRKDMAQKALGNSKAIVLENWDDTIDLVNEYAAEHLILACQDAEVVAEKIVNAGSVFIGNYSPESAGDYASGTNHTLPTNGFAKAYSGVSTESFVKKITYQKLSKAGLQGIGETVIQMAEAEGLQAHAEAIRIRLKHTDTENK